MKRRVITSYVFLLFISTICNGQSISAGYFNGHIYANLPSQCSGFYTSSNPLTGASLDGNNFTISIGQSNPTNFAGCASTVGNSTYDNYAPGSLPVGSGWPDAGVTFFDADYGTNNSGYTNFTFTNDLPYLTNFHIVDIDYGEQITVEFLDAANIPQPIDNIKVLQLSDAAALPGTVSYPSTTQITLTSFSSNTAPDPGFAFVLFVNNIRTIRFTQNSALPGGSYDFTLSKGTVDHGDAPATYGDPQHFPIAALKLGNNAPDAESTPNYSTNADGDNQVSGSSVIDDEDGATFSPIANSGANPQVISSYSVSATITNLTGKEANVIAWIDWNNNGVFEPSEGVVATTVPTGSNNVTRTFTWTNATLNGTGGTSQIYLRIRLTTDPITTANANSSPTTLPFCVDGEVEDYAIPLVSVLPIHLSYFNVELNSGCTNKLNWKTETENSFKYFIIEYSSTGREFTPIGEVLPKGDNSIYSFMHNATGVSYYRLKLIDNDGTFTYSKIVVVTKNCLPQNATITPNPAHDKVVLSGLGTNEKSIAIYDNTGRLMWRLVTVKNAIDLDISGWTKGIYFVTIDAALNPGSLRLIIE